ncbi:ribosomal protein L22/L17 [Spinellus fusiger]|nr:ribosomal protein L22/L17 [Spinellus fusiger]
MKKAMVAFRALPSASFSTTSQCLADPPAIQRPELGVSSLFDNIQAQAQKTLVESSKKPEEKVYTWSSAAFSVSPQKLNMIARQIRQLPVDEAIQQMEFSNKRMAKKVLHNLAFARQHAQTQKGMKNLVVAQTWVGKGRFMQRVNFHGRGQFGMKHIKEASISFLLKEAVPPQEQAVTNKRAIRGWKDTKKVWTPLIENKPIYNPKSFYNW